MSKRYNFNNNPVNTTANSNSARNESEEKTMNANSNSIPMIPAEIIEKNHEMLKFIAEENNWRTPKTSVWEEKGLKGYNFGIEMDKAWKCAGRYYAYGFQPKHKETALTHLERAYKLLGLDWNPAMAWEMYIAQGLLRTAKDKVTNEEYMTISTKGTMTKKGLKMFFRMVNGKSVILTNESMDKSLSEATAKKGKKAQSNEEKLMALIEAMGKDNVLALFKDVLAA